MNYQKDLIKYRTDRAYETLEEAKQMVRDNHWNGAANRLYYACFYILSALFVKDGIRAHTHSGVKTLFYKDYIKTGKVKKEFGDFYSDLFDKRQEGDYRDFQKFDSGTILPLISESEKFIKNIKALTDS